MGVRDCGILSHGHDTKGKLRGKGEERGQAKREREDIFGSGEFRGESSI